MTLLAVGGIGCVLAVLAPVAAAYTVSPTGIPGSITNVTQVEGGKYNAQVEFLKFNPLKAYRSSSYSYNQVVQITWRLWVWHRPGSYWQKANEATTSVTLPPGVSYSVPDATFTMNSYLNGGGDIWSGDIIVRWKTPGGTSLGTKHIDFSAVGDYYCHGSVAVCEPVLLSSSAGAGMWID